MTAVRADHLDELISLELLGSVAGRPAESVESQPLNAPGYSGASLSRLLVHHGDGTPTSLVLKRVQLGANWVADRTGDAVGREAALLGEPALDDVWSVFASPYRAYARDGSEVALLMEDLTDHLLPDVDEPLTMEQEDGLLTALASLHAVFWESAVLQIGWLASPRQVLGVLAAETLPGNTTDGETTAVPGLAMQGWARAFSMLPEAAAAVLRRPIASTVAEYSDLPRTLLHGDAKVANFAIMPGGRVAAFDWALMGAGPCGMDLGWYLAINASRLARPKEAVIARYRELLETARGEPLAHGVWERLERLAVVTGAHMLLWSKAPAGDGDEKTAAEWEWWVERLAALR
ncbi:MAG: phosphotransferase [Chloroflexi bacterium]|nr:phosphotransferase [Chloroflexota bacterium]